jgi:hypothetical protein
LNELKEELISKISWKHKAPIIIKEYESFLSLKEEKVSQVQNIELKLNIQQFENKKFWNKMNKLKNVEEITFEL